MGLMFPIEKNVVSIFFELVKVSADACNFFCLHVLNFYIGKEPLKRTINLTKEVHGQCDGK